MLPFRLVTFCALAAFISGCSSLSNKEPFQIYAPRTDCVSCKEQERWGFVEYPIHRHNKIIHFANFEPKTTSTLPIRLMGLCYGTAIETIKSGATHFRILDKETWGNWREVPTPARVNIDIFGMGTIYSGGMVRKNLDQFSMWWNYHYYEVGSPSCENTKDICSDKNKFNIQDCPYEGESLRKETEEKKGSLACVMKRNPRLLLHDVYLSEAACDSSGSLERDNWIPANDVIKKYEAIFNIDK